MRLKYNLNGHWNFKLDEHDIGEKDQWFSRALAYEKEVTVPHIWQREIDLVNYTGIAWYEKQFELPESFKGKRVFLCFEAVDFHSVVWINGELIGEHEGGFTPFEFDITDAISFDGINRLTVRVYDPADNAEIPIGKQGSWYTRVSGIWQDVYIESRSGIFINNVHVHPNIEEETAEVHVNISGNTNNIKLVEYSITNHMDTNHILTLEDEFDEKDLVKKINIPNVQLWSPNQPHLYDINIKLKDGNNRLIDEYKTYFGMRKIEFKDGQLLLNGAPLFIRGALDQSYYPKTIYVAPDDEWIQKEIKTAKEFGFNLLRKHIKVELPRYLYWADRLGMLIWAEVPNVIKWSKQSMKRFQNELSFMINRDFNHPSIIIWSIFNEEWGLEWDLANDQEKQEYVIKMYTYLKELDPTRLICDNSGWNHVKTDINDYHRYFTLPEQNSEWKDDLDYYIINNPENNYVPGYIPKDEPIIISEFGVWGLPSIKSLLEYYGEEPIWFHNLGDDTHREDFKIPLTAYENFKKYQVNKVFGDLENLSKFSQKRMFRSVKSLIEEMRKRPQINGYVITEFTDVEWETNGWMDYTRSVKQMFENAKNFNGNLVVMANVLKHNFWSEEIFTCDVIISNHDLLPISGELIWQISGTNISGVIALNEENKAYIQIQDAIKFAVPVVGDASFYHLKLKLILENGVEVENYEELTFSTKVEVNPVTVFPYKMGNQFIEKLKLNGMSITNQFEDAEVVITNVLDAAVNHYNRRGGKVLFLAEEGDQLTDKGLFTFRRLPEGESWDRTSSFNYVDCSYFDGLPINKEMGWELEGIFPDYIIPISNYNKLGGTVGRIVYMFGNENTPKVSRILSGYFQGWIGQFGTSMIVQNNSSGILTLTTWKLIKNYGEHPIATRVVNKLIENLISGKA